MTIMQLFAYAKAEGYVDELPSANLPRFPDAADLDRFRTIAEIDAIVDRGGLSHDEINELWGLRRGAENSRVSESKLSGKSSDNDDHRTGKQT